MLMNKLLLLLTIFGVLQAFLVIGLLPAIVQLVLTEEPVEVFEPPKRYLSKFSDFGGLGPSIAGAVAGITVGVLVESGVILSLAAITIYFDYMGMDTFVLYSAFGVLLGIGLAVKTSERIDLGIRSSGVYRGYE